MVGQTGPELVTGVAYDALVAAAPGALTEEELRQLLVQADAVRARLDAAVASLAGSLDARAAWAVDGARGPVQWLAARTATSTRTCRADVRVGRALRDMPLVEAAAREGRLSRDKVQALAWARQPDLEDAFAWCEEQLVREVEGPTAAGAWRYVRRWVQSMRELLERNEPDGPEPTEGEGPSKVTLAPGLDGRWFGSLDLGAEDGEIVATAVEQQLQAMFDAKVFHGDDGLTMPERRAAALVEVVRRGTRGGADEQTARPLVLGIIGMSDLQRRPMSSEDEVPLTLSELSWSGPVRPETLRRLACEGDVVPVIVGEDGTPLDMGRRIRLANRAQRRALRVRDGHCAFAGCHVPAQQCIAHHIVEWQAGGRTDLRSMCLLCRYHHRVVHEGGFRLGWHGDVLRTFRPDGSVVAVRDDAPPLLQRHRPPPDRRGRRRHPHEVDTPDGEELYARRCARARFDALLAETRERRAAS